jgi:hypothetical protein
MLPTSGFPVKPDTLQISTLQRYFAVFWSAKKTFIPRSYGSIYQTGGMKVFLFEQLKVI